MKTNRLHALTASDQGEVSPYSMVFFVAMIIALVLASLPITNVFAAPASVTETDDLAREWQNKIHNLRPHSLFYQQVRLYPADFEDPNELTQAYDLLNKYSLALRRATTIVSTHAGFDMDGKVIDDEQAIKSIEDLAENLRIMRGIWTKLDEGGYEFHRLK